MPVDVMARRKAHRIRREIETLEALTSELDLDGRKALGHRLKQLQRANAAFNDLNAKLDSYEGTLENRDKVRSAKADVARQFLAHVRGQGDPAEFKAEAPAEIVEAKVALNSGLKQMVSIAADALEIARADAFLQARDDYGEVFAAMVERLDDLKPNPNELTHAEYLSAVEKYEATRERLVKTHFQLVKQTHSYELQGIKGGEAMVRMYLINVEDFEAEDKRARAAGRKVDLSKLVHHADGVDQSELDKARAGTQFHRLNVAEVIG